MGPNVEVFGIYARRVVAVMQNVRAGRDLSIREGVSESVRFVVLPIEAESSISPVISMRRP
jgi:hypothetical protein